MRTDTKPALFEPDQREGEFAGLCELIDKREQARNIEIVVGGANAHTLVINGMILDQKKWQIDIKNSFNIYHSSLPIFFYIKLQVIRLYFLSILLIY